MTGSINRRRIWIRLTIYFFHIGNANVDRVPFALGTQDHGHFFFAWRWAREYQTLVKAAEGANQSMD
jgi:hypothetical protein